jgi:AcrR family transcriptional regulator
MSKLSKGQLSRKKIISEAREVFNRKGSQITIQELALELGEGVSYITNHYRTKDHLIVAIAGEYEEKYYEILQRSGQDLDTLEKIVRLISAIMDLQYHYRCAILTVVASSSSQKVLFKQIQESYHKNVENFSAFIQLLVSNKIAGEMLLQKEELSVFRFQYVNLHTTWVVSLELYDHPAGYKKMKPLYLKGIVNCFLPYLTPIGMKQYKAIDFKKFR